MNSFPFFNLMHYDAFVGVTSPLETPSPRSQVSGFARLLRSVSVSRRSHRGRAIARHRARVMAG
ncbi:MAG TPA: hypothetical protein VF627_03805 [Abditibacterium sp.]|jgi:hypothetical protein